MSPVVTVLVVLVLALALALVATGYRLLQVVRERDAARAEAGELAERLRREDTPPPPRSVRAAGKVLATVVETAGRVREQGVGGMLLSSLDDLTRWALEDRQEIVRIAGPDGTVTFFFSDIEDSTHLNNAVGDARWVKVLAAYDDLVTTYVDRYRGHVVKTQGDGHMVVFSTPELAVRAALDVQRALNATWNRSRQLRRTPVRVRIGLHTGTAVARDGDYFGRNVALAARVAAEAQGGEVLVSGPVREATAEQFGFEDAGEVELKGFEERHRLWHVEAG